MSDHIKFLAVFFLLLNKSKVKLRPQMPTVLMILTTNFLRFKFDVVNLTRLQVLKHCAKIDHNFVISFDLEILFC